MIRNCKVSWIYNELKDYMTKVGEVKKTAQKTGSVTDRQKYCKLRNYVTKLNIMYLS